MEEKVQEINMSFVQSAKKNKKGEMNWLIPSLGTNIKKVMIKQQSSIITFRETWNARLSYNEARWIGYDQRNSPKKLVKVSTAFHHFL